MMETYEFESLKIGNVYVWGSVSFTAKTWDTGKEKPWDESNCEVSIDWSTLNLDKVENIHGQESSVPRNLLHKELARKVWDYAMDNVDFDVVEPMDDKKWKDV